MSPCLQLFFRCLARSTRHTWTSCFYFFTDGKQHKASELDMITLRNQVPRSYMTWLRSRYWIRKFTVRFRPIIKEIVSSMYNNDTYYWVYLPSDHPFQVYNKVRRLILLKSARAFLLQSVTSVITMCDRTKCDDYYKERQNSVHDQRMKSRHFTHTDITWGWLNRSGGLHCRNKNSPYVRSGLDLLQVDLS